MITKLLPSGAMSQLTGPVRIPVSTIQNETQSITD
jgi:hypothetical protein